MSRMSAALRIARPAATILPPLTPAAYMRLRREAARLSISQVVERIEPHLRARRDKATMLAMFERDGIVVRDTWTIAPLQHAFRIDLDVYAQLRDEPADRHPAICRGCGCSQNDPCVGRDGHSTCAWTAPGLCTGCAPEVGARRRG